MATSPYAAGRTPTTDEMNQICEAILGNTSGATPNRKLKLDATDSSTDAISERTAAAGVTIDGLLLKDGALLGTLKPYAYNGGGTGGASAQAIASGSWSPTVTAVTNITTITASGGYWIRIGNIVHCVVVLAITPTTTGVINARVSLPVASAFTAQAHCTGFGGEYTLVAEGGGFQMQADTTNDEVLLIGTIAATTTSRSHRYGFTYLVL